MKDILKEHLSKKRRLITLDGKIPLIKGWQNATLTTTELSKHKGNFGWVLSATDLVVDIDVRNGGKESIKRLLADLDIKLTPNIQTAGGGWHIYLSKPADMKIRKTLKEYEGIDFLSRGNYCVIIGEKYKVLSNINRIKSPEPLLAILAKDSKNNSNDSEFDFLLKSTVSEQEVTKKLNKLNSSMHYEQWVKVGMALHHWDANKGLELWENWSKGADNYEAGKTAKQWQAFDDKKSNLVTLGTLYHMGEAADYDKKADEIDKLLVKIDRASVKEIELELLKIIKKLDINAIEREQIAKKIQSRLHLLTSAKLPIAKVRAMIQADIEHEAGNFNDWVYINSHKCYMNTKDNDLFKTEAFDVACTRIVPPDENGNRTKASTYCMQNGIVDVYSKLMYLPKYEKKYLKIDNKKVVNSFDFASLPKPADKISAKAHYSITMIRQHLKILCGNNADYGKILEQWLAFQIQHRGEKLLWVPIIQSIEGVGKSFLAVMLRCCLGNNNINVVYPMQVKSEFNGWATGACVNVLEELKIQGHNRYDVTNSLKSLLIDDMIQINEKGLPHYNTQNTANYICFTNYKDAIPIRDDDRRWWVVYCPLKKLTDLKQYTSYEVNEYYDMLFGALREYPSEIHRWLLDYEISDEFLAMKQAPETKYKNYLIDTEEAACDGLDELRDLINIGKEGCYNDSVILFSELADDYKIQKQIGSGDDKRLISDKRVVFLLKKLGYIVINKQFTSFGKRYRVWGKEYLDVKAIRNELVLQKAI